MRPGSRGGVPSFGQQESSSGAPPSTGMRPGSGRKPPSTAQRLRTGVTPSGPGTQAAQGFAINAAINVMDRPVTGQGVMGMKGMTSSGGRLVEDTSYYVGLLRKKMNDITTETRKLKVEIDQQAKDAAQYSQLEKRYETLIKNKENLEGQLADYNLALDKTRSSTDPEDIKQMTLHLAEKNRQTGQELDRIFILRKQKEGEVLNCEDQIQSYYKQIQSRINDLEPGKLRAYNDLLAKQKDLFEKIHMIEAKTNEANVKIRHYESENKTSSFRKEYLSLEKAYQLLKKDLDSLIEELEIASLDPKEAHSKFVARVNDFKNLTKNVEDKITLQKEEIQSLKRTVEDLDNQANNKNTADNSKEDEGDANKYELLQKRDEEMTAFMDKFDDNRNSVLEEQQKAKDVIVALLEHIGRGIDEQSNMVTPEQYGDMEDNKTFKEKNLATAQKTMESLQVEKKKRERELELLKSSEPKLRQELQNVRESMLRMRTDMDAFQDLDTVRVTFNATKKQLAELKQVYVKRRDGMRQQVQALSVEHESLKKTLNSSDIAREVDDTEKRLKHYERSIFELKEFVETRKRETDFEIVKSSCLKLLDNWNTTLIKRNQMITRNAQAKW